MAGIRGIAQRLSWGLGDQAVSSMSNFIVGLYVAHELGVNGFGVFSLAWVTYGLVLNISRGVATDPLTVRFSAVAVDRWRAAVARSTGTAISVGLAFGVISVAAGFAMGGTLGRAFVALGVVAPGLLLQDAWRFAFFAHGTGHKAFLNDVIWAVSMIPLLMLAAAHGTVTAFVLAWGGAALFAGLCGWLQSGIRPRLDDTRGWLHKHRDLGSRYLVENVSNSGAAQLRMYGIGAIVGLSGVGAIRGAELLLGPFLALLMGVSLVSVPEAARVVRRAPHRLGQFCLALGGVQAVAALAWGLVLLFVPDSVGWFVLNDVWDYAKPLILPVTLSVAGAGIVAGATAGLRALGAARRSLRAQLFASAGYLGGGLAGALIAGTTGATWGSAIAMWCGAAMWWLQLRAGLRGHLADQTIEFAPVTAPIPVLRGGYQADHHEMRTP
jgi:O-antigen/teichoic acid export membrane protein